MLRIRDCHHDVEASGPRLQGPLLSKNGGVQPRMKETAANIEGIMMFRGGRSFLFLILLPVNSKQIDIINLVITKINLAGRRSVVSA